MARFIMSGERSWYVDRLPFSRFSDVDRVLAETQAFKLQR
jgi:hypothetical protein